MQAQLHSFDCMYYRTHNQEKVDLVLQGHFGLVPIEIKTGQTTPSKQLKSLVNFIRDYDCAYGIVVNNCERPSLLLENVIETPAGCL